MVARVSESTRAKIVELAVITAHDRLGPPKCEADEKRFDQEVDTLVAMALANNGKPTGIGDLADLLDPALAKAKARRNRDEVPVTTPWAQLNDTLGGGFWPGAHYLVAGTGVGKSQLTFQIALHAAEQGIPVGLVALELDDISLPLRIACEKANVTWSKLYNGSASDEELARVELVLPAIKKLPIRVDFSEAHGWPASRLELMCKELRATHPAGPALIVLDFIQLVGKEASADRADIRERIGMAGYLARNLARRYGMSFVIISSTSRANYSALSQSLKKAGLRVDNSGRRYISQPDALIGLGKESGELEFSGDTVTVLMTPPPASHYDDVIKEMGGRGKVIVVATPKQRAGQPSWFALLFSKARFSTIPEASINSMATEPDVTDEELEAQMAENQDARMQMVADALEAALGVDPMAKVSSKGQIYAACAEHPLRGRKFAFFKLVDEAVQKGYIAACPGGGFERAKPV